MDYNYSVDYLKRAAFTDELNNMLRTLPEEEVTPEIIDVMEYLEERIKDIDNRYKMKE